MIPARELGNVATKTKILVMLGLLVGINVLVWLLTWAASRQYPFLLATGLLAYGFGLRHAVDADHIVAIDNTTRKLMQDGKRPVGVGLFFSLGHSTIVILLCALLAVSTAYVQEHLKQWGVVGGTVGTLVSTLFLYGIGLINLVVLWDGYKTLRALRDNPGSTDDPLSAGKTRGLLSRLLAPLLGMIRHSWQMYFVGFLFGLGFDTATEIGILALSARSGQFGVPFWVVMLLPALFTAGMCLVDAANGALMLGAYGWAYVQPIRKLYYNLGITVVSVVLAFAIATGGLLELLGTELEGPLWVYLDNYLGFFLVGIFLALWALAVFVYKRQNYEAA